MIGWCIENHFCFAPSVTTTCSWILFMTLLTSVAPRMPEPSLILVSSLVFILMRWCTGWVSWQDTSATPRPGSVFAFHWNMFFTATARDLKYKYTARFRPLTASNSPQSGCVASNGSHWRDADAKNLRWKALFDSMSISTSSFACSCSSLALSRFTARAPRALHILSCIRNERSSTSCGGKASPAASPHKSDNGIARNYWNILQLKRTPHQSYETMQYAVCSNAESKNKIIIYNYDMIIWYEIWKILVWLFLRFLLIWFVSIISIYIMSWFGNWYKVCCCKQCTNLKIGCHTHTHMRKRSWARILSCSS